MSNSFQYVECDIPEDLSLDEWRRRREHRRSWFKTHMVQTKRFIAHLHPGRVTK